MIDHVVSSAAHHVYISQTDKGEVVMGGRLDGYNSYSQRGAFPVIEDVLDGACELFPQIAGLKLMRTWAGAVDMTMDGAPIISATPVGGFYLDGGWCYGGFKATPASGYCFAQLIATGAPPRLIEKFSLDRFRSGRVVNERGLGPKPGDH
jgi:sarcosine oxidase subunit beta